VLCRAETGALAQDRDRAAVGGLRWSAFHLWSFCCCLDQGLLQPM